ncbi:hypothetical protein ACVWXN_005414 [Bradyrhizobium sp. i1.4.4]
MALSNDDIQACANRLHQAEKTRTQIRQLSQDFPGITIADAYAIQKAWVDLKLAEGRTVKGHKIGLTSKAMQSALNIDEPDSGVLLDDMFLCRWRPRPDRALHRHARRGRARLRHEQAPRGAGLHDVRRAQRHRLRRAGAGDPGHAHRTCRSRHQGDTKNLRHRRRQRGECRHRALWTSDPPAGRRPALDRRALLQERPARGDGPCRRRAQSSRNRRGLARQQDRAARPCARARPDRACRLLHPSDRDPQGRHNSGPIMAPTAR